MASLPKRVIDHIGLAIGVSLGIGDSITLSNWLLGTAVALGGNIMFSSSLVGDLTQKQFFDGGRIDRSFDRHGKRGQWSDLIFSCV